MICVCYEDSFTCLDVEKLEVECGLNVVGDMYLLINVSQVSTVLSIICD